MKCIIKFDLFNGKEVFLKEGDEAWQYINQGYKVYIPDGFYILIDSGLVVKDNQNINPIELKSILQEQTQWRY